MNESFVNTYIYEYPTQSACAKHIIHSCPKLFLIRKCLFVIFWLKHNAALSDMLSAHNVRPPDTCRRTRYHTLKPTLTQRLGSPTAHAPPTPLSGYSNLDGQAHSGSDTDVKLEPALSAYDIPHRLRAYPIPG